MAGQSFELKFLVEASQAIAGLKNLVSEAQGRFAEIKQAASSSGLGKIFEFAGAFLAISQLKSMAAEAGQSAATQGRLDKALQTTGQFSADYRTELGRQATAIRDLTKTGEDEIRRVQEKLVVYGAQRNNIEALTKATLDLAKFKEIDPVSAAEMIGRSIKEGGMALRDFHIELDKNADTPTRIKAITEALNARIGGYANSNSPFKAYTLEMGDLRKQIGSLVLETEKPFFRGLADGLRTVNTQVRAFLTAHPGFVAALKSTGAAAGDVVRNNFGLIASFVGVVSAVTLLGTSMTLLRPVLGFLNVGFTLLGGTAIMSFVRALSAGQAAFGFFGGYVTVATGSLTAFRVALYSVSTALAVVATAIAAFKLGGFIAELRVGEATVTQWATRIVIGLKGILNDVSTWAQSVATTMVAELEKLFIRAEAKFAAFVAYAQRAMATVRGFFSSAASSGPVADPEADAAKQIAAIDAASAAVQGAITAAHDAEAAKYDLQKRILDRDIANSQPPPAKPDEPVSPTAPEVPLAAAGTTNAGGGGKASGGGGGGSPAAREKEVDEAAEAEKSYAMLLDITKGKLEVGDITQGQANAENRKTITDYITRLKQLQSALSPASDKFKEITVRILAARAALQQTTAFGQISATLRKVVNEWGDIGKNASTWISTSMNSGISAVSQGLTGLITKTGNWRQVFNSAISSMLQGLIELGVKTIAHYALMAILMLANKALGTSTTTATVSEQTAAGTAIATAHAPAAAATSISSYGVAAAVGVVLAIAAIGAIIALLAGGFATGGLIPGGPSHSDNRIARVATGEYIVRTAAVQHYGVGLLEAINSMGLPMQMPAYAAGGLVGSGGAALLLGMAGSGKAGSNPPPVNVAGAKVTLIQPHTRAAMHEAMRSAEGDVIILDAIQRNKHRMPFKQ